MEQIISVFQELCSFVVNIIPSVITAIITALVAYHFTKKQILISHKNAIIESLVGGKEKPYVNCIKSVDKVTKNCNIVFNNQYVYELLDYKSEIKLRGSQQVQDSYEKFLNYVWNINTEYNKYTKFIDEQCHNENDDGGNLSEEEVQIIISRDLDVFIDNHQTDTRKINELIKKIQESIRQDMM